MIFNNLPPTIPPDHANKIVQVLNIFETGSKEGKYDTLVVYEDFLYNSQRYKQITYGKSQTTEFGNLKTLLQMYVSANGKYSALIQPYIHKIGIISGGTPISLCNDENLKVLLRKAAKEDFKMKEIQDKFFERYYFQPALAFFTHHQFTFPLSLLVIYDSFIHSGSILMFLRQRFSEMPPLQGGDEKTWIKQYVNVRHEWLGSHTYKTLRNTVYRTELFKKLIADNNWYLQKRFITQGITFE